MYIAKKDKGYGSTRLHMDVADAWNVLHHGLANWLLFRRQDGDSVTEFFRECGIFIGPGHPIHAQQIYVTDDILSTLEEKTGIRPYKFRQCQGDMVFIPVRCIHQVKFSFHS
jgi:[histone H3]-dimethyl-L-lysine9 demethylase